MIQACYIYLVLFFFGALLGFHSFAQDFFSCSEQGLLLVMLLGLLTAVTSLLAECGLSTRGLSSSARSLRSMWDLPGPGLEPKSPALACGDSYPPRHQGSPTLCTFIPNLMPPLTRQEVLVCGLEVGDP